MQGRFSHFVRPGSSDSKHSPGHSPAALPALSFFIMRHGETESNSRGVISGGDDDSPLTDLGCAQAEKAKSIYRLLPPCRIVTTGLKRTTDTALIMSGHSAHIVEPDLRERLYRTYDGKITEKELGKLKNPDIETRAQHKERAVAALNRHLEASDDLPLLMVAHGGTIRRLVEALFPQKKSGRFEVGNAEMFKFSYLPSSGTWAVSRLGINEKGQLVYADVTPERALPKTDVSSPVISSKL